MNLEQARQIAQDETTAPKLLAELANSEDKQTRKAVAANPNIPIETLLSICFEFPRQVIDNPIIPLLILENSDCLTCKIPLDFNKIFKLINIEMKRLGWTKEQGRNYLKKKYGKRSRLHLRDEELLDCLSRLRCLNVNHILAFTEKTSQQSSTESLDEIPF